MKLNLVFTSLVLLASGLLNLGAANAQVEFDTIILTDDIIPGLATDILIDEIFSIQPAGDNVFFLFRGDESDVDFTNDNALAAVRTNEEVNLEFVARELDPAPGIDNTRFDLASLPSANISGDVVFRTTLSGLQSNNIAVYFWDGQLQLVARRGMMAPDSTSQMFSDFDVGAINRSDSFPFFASLQDIGSSEVTGGGVYVFSDGELQKFADTNSEVDAFPFPVNFTAVTANTEPFSLIATNTKGQIACRAGIDGLAVNFFNNEVIVSDSTGDLQIVARTADPVPLLDGVSFGGDIVGENFRNINITSSGQVAFVSSLGGQGVTSDNDTAVFIENGDSIEMIVREGDTATGTKDNAVFGGSNVFDKMGVTQAGDVYFSSDLVSANQDSFWVKSSNKELQLLLRQGDSAPQTSLSFVNLFGMAVNESGQFAVNGSLDTNDNTVNTGLWGTDAQNNLRLLVRKGTQVDVDSSPDAQDMRTITGISFGVDPDLISVSEVLSDDGILRFVLELDSGLSCGVFQINMNDSVPEVEILALTNQSAVPASVPAQSFATSSFSSFSPVINEQGDAAFLSQSRAAIVVCTEEEGIRAIARENGPVAGLGSEFEWLDDFSFFTLNDNGDLAFIGDINPIGSTISVWSDELFTVVADDDFVIPGTNTTIFNFEERPALNDRGDIIFSPRISGGDAILIRYVDDDGLTLIARDGDQAPNFPADFFFTNFFSAQINDQGLAVFSALISGPENVSATFGHLDGVTGPVISSLDQAPGLPDGVKFNGATRLSINQTGQIVTTNSLRGPGITDLNDNCLVKCCFGSPDLTEVLAREGDLISGYEEGFLFGDFFDISSNRSGSVATCCRIRGSSVNTSNDEAVIFISPEGDAEIAVRENEPAPDLPAFARIDGDFEIALSDSGQLAFMSDVNGFGRGAFLFDRETQQLQKLAVEGDLFDINDSPDVEDLRTIEEVHLRPSTGTENGTPTSINSSGQVVFALDFTDGTEGIFVGNTLPEVLHGDVNRDGVVNLLDVALFVELVSQSLFQPEADVNKDGVVNLLDVQPFVDLLAG